MNHGIYVDPQAVAQSPDYARALVEEGGVRIFQLRAGFDPNSAAPGMEEAIRIIRRLNARVWFLVGSWWGHGVEPGEDRMEPVAAQDRAGLTPAHEAQWAMRTPGGPADDDIESAIRGLCARHEPDGICLTHARYRHSADIPGMFEWGVGSFGRDAEKAGVTPVGLEETWVNALAGLRGLDSQELRDLAEVDGPEDLLDDLSDNGVMVKWTDYRCEAIEKSISRFRDVIRESGGDGVAFGVNAFHPSAAVLAGQSISGLAPLCDFIQPLLGYVRWHVLQPVGAWARLFLDTVEDLVEPEAIELAAELFGLNPEWIPLSFEELARADEGDPKAIEEVVAAELRTIGYDQTTTQLMMPVLRGRGWPEPVIDRLAACAADQGISTLFFQGTDWLAGPAPSEGWG